MRKHRVAIVAAMIVAATAALLARPVRYAVDGVSMGPGLLPGDVVSASWFSRWGGTSETCRFERWIVTLPDGSTGLKRLIGLPGETLSLVDGDLSVDGRRILKGPRLLAESGSIVATANLCGASTWSAPATRVLDDAPFAVNEVSRLMLPVRDGGFGAEVTVSSAAVATGPARLRAEAGPLRITWQISAAGRYAIVAGRLDGHAVAATWPLSVTPAFEPPRRILPAGAAEAWDVTRPWPSVDTAMESDDESAPSLAIEILAPDPAGVTIDRVVTWRDILYRPAADGVTQWSLGSGNVFVLGDFPSGSRDSRHFGPLPVIALRHRLP